MAVAFDASILIDLFNPRLKGDRLAKLDNLVAELQKKRTINTDSHPSAYGIDDKSGSST